MKQLYYWRVALRNLWVLAAWGISITLSAQSPPSKPAPQLCGTKTPSSHFITPLLAPAYQRYEQDFVQQSLTKSLVVDTVPVQIHVLRTTAGTGGLSVADFNAMFAIVNNYYANANIYFKFCGAFNYIDNSTYYDFDTNDEAALTSANNVANKINIYFANTITSGGSGLCGYAYFPGGPDVILMDNSCAINGSTLSHEIGHYFGLYHTHETGLGAELVNGSNCANAGDLICDTPADPTLSNSVVNTSCIYTGTATDANGALYNPDPRNIMSYSRKTCRDTLTPLQYARIASTNALSRTYLTCGTGGGGGTGYCLPTYANTCASGDYIEDVIFNTISNIGTGCAFAGTNNFSNYTSLSTNVTTSMSYTISVKVAPQYGQYVVAFIDFNQDQDFDDAGEFFNVGYAAANGTVTANLAIPNTATLGTTRLRVLCQYNTAPLTQAAACATTLTYGEVEDYTVIINAPALLGETCSNPFVITSLPYNHNGSTTNFTDDYVEYCGFSTSGGKDVVYTYTPNTTQVANISLCTGITDYDTRLYIYQNSCPMTGGGAMGNPYACNDDNCANPPIYTNNFISSLSNISFNAGTTYYIVVDGYDGSSAGNYTLDIQLVAPPSCSNTVSSFPSSYGFENTLSNWTQSSADDFDWTILSGSTASSLTGPDNAYAGNYYVYTESSSPNYPQKTAIIESPCFDITNLSNPYISFARHLYGATMGSLSLEISINSGMSWTQLWTLSGNQGNTWTKDSVSLAAYTGIVKFRFLGVTGSSYESDMAIDEVKIYNHVALPNLTFVANSGTLSVTGTQVNAAFTMENNGLGNAAANVLKWYLSADQIITLSDYEIGTQSVTALNAGATALYSLNVDALIVNPSIPAGTYYVGILIDANNDIAETDETDNNGYFSSPQVTVVPTALPGETCNNPIAIASIPYTVNGNSANYTDNYVEYCGFSASGGKDVVYSYFATTTQTVDISLCTGVTDYDTRLYIYENTCPAAGGGATGNPYACNDDSCANAPIYTLSYISSISNVTFISGKTYYIVVDGFDATESGNYTLSIQPISGANLTYVVNTTSLSVNNTLVNASFTMQNSGNLPTGTHILKWYLSSDNIIMNSDYDIGTQIITSSAANSSTQYNLMTDVMVANPAIPTGTYYVGVLIDALDDVVELNESDNSFYFTAPTVSITNTPPDLAFAMTGNNLLVNGTQITVNTAIENTGTNLAAATVVKWYASTDVTINSSDYELGFESVPAINGGAISNHTFNKNLATITPLLPVGTYYIGVIIDANNDVVESNEANNIGYFSNTQVTISCPSITVNNTLTSPSCHNNNDGSVTLVPSGGNSPYTYSWNTGQSTATIGNLSAGTYSYTITDALGCSNTGSIVLTASAQLITQHSVSNVSCNGGNDGAIIPTTSGGVPPYTYAWSSGNGTALPVGTYSFTVTDINNCSTTTTNIVVTQPTSIELIDTVIINETSAGAGNGSIDITVAGGTPNYTYLWSNGATTQDLTAISGGSYTCTVTDANGCVAVFGTFDNVTSSFDKEQLYELKLFPNPSKGIFSVQLNLSTPQSGVLSIYDAQGKQVSKEMFDAAKLINMPINLTSHPAGVYFVVIQIENSDTSITRRVVINK